MAREITITLHTFDELSDAAKERAINDCRDSPSYLDYEWWDSVFDDFIQVAEMLGIDLDTRAVHQGNGRTRKEPMIYFSGFCSQGDGASWFGSWDPAADGPSYYDLVKDHAPEDTELHKIAAALDSVREDLFGPDALGHEKVESWDLDIRVVPISSRYSHENTMTLDLGYGPHVYLLDEQSIDEDEYSSIHDQVITNVHALLEGNPNSWDDCVLGIFRDLARWLYRRLEKEYDYLHSDEAVAEHLEANGYEFTDDGAQA